jgi:diazepam-binding inhibitor (GABA receptor modulator, acyl-CoA-binding protein)
MQNSLQKKFEDAVQNVAAGKVGFEASREDKLNLYGLYKQATAGDVAHEKPGFNDFAGRLKHLAWQKYKGLTANEAMQQYIDYVAKKEIA